MFVCVGGEAEKRKKTVSATAHHHGEWTKRETKRWAKCRVKRRAAVGAGPLRGQITYVYDLFLDSTIVPFRVVRCFKKYKQNPHLKLIQQISL